MKVTSIAVNTIDPRMYHINSFGAPFYWVIANIKTDEPIAVYNNVLNARLLFRRVYSEILFESILYSSILGLWLTTVGV